MGDSKLREGMRFRDLEYYNTAMLLAKQSWRLLNQPSSLEARIMKEEYHRDGGLLEAKLAHCPFTDLEEYMVLSGPH